MSSTRGEIRSRSVRRSPPSRSRGCGQTSARSGSPRSGRARALLPVRRDHRSERGLVVGRPRGLSRRRGSEARHRAGWFFQPVIWLGCRSNCLASSASVLSPRTAASATRALNVGVWLRRDLLLTLCSAFSGLRPVLWSRLSTYPTAQISGATSITYAGINSSRADLARFRRMSFDHPPADVIDDNDAIFIVRGVWRRSPKQPLEPGNHVSLRCDITFRCFLHTSDWSAVSRS